MSFPSTGSPRPGSRVRESTELLAPGSGTLSTLSPLIAPGSSRGVAASLSAGDDGLELSIRSALDPEREDASPGFFAAFPGFDPSLDDDLPARTLAYLGFGAPADTVTALLSQASSQAPGIAAGFRDLVEGIRRSADLDLERGVLEALGDEAAIALEPPAGGDLAAEAPYGLFAADDVDEVAARAGLAALGGSLTQRSRGGGAAPAFGQEDVEGVQTNTVRVSPTVELTYAVFDGLAAIATDPAGVAAMIEGDGGLADQDRYQRATEGFPDQVSLQAYLDLDGLVAIGEAAGLAEDPLYATFAGDFRRLEALGLAVSSDGRRARHRRSAAGRRRGRHGDVDHQPRLRQTDRGRFASNLLRHMTEKLGDNEYLFTSESVTEGHPDKVADQISDGVLDAVLADDEAGRVACETLVNTGLVVVSGEISTSTYVDIQEIARETIRKIGYTDADLGFSADSCAVINAIDKQSPDIAQGVDHALETRTDPSRRGRARRRRRGRPGDDVRLREP